MTLEVLLLGVVSPLVLMIIGWIFTRAMKQSEKIHGIDIRMTKSEEKLHGHGNRITLTEEALADIRDNMVRREDFDRGLEVLGKQLDQTVRVLRNWKT